MKHRRFFAFVLACVFLSETPAEAQDKSVLVVIKSIKKSTDEISKKPVCEYSYSIENNSYGTLYQLRVGGHAEGSSKSFFFLSNTKRGFINPVPVALSETYEGSSNYLISEDDPEEECMKIQEITVNPMSDSDCNIRMLPEEVKCSDHVTVLSEIPSVSIKSKP